MGYIRQPDTIFLTHFQSLLRHSQHRNNMQTNASKISMSGAPFVRSTLIKSCLCDDSTESTNRDLLGVCGFYILTDDRNLLRYYPLQPDLGEWLSDQFYKATGKRDAFQVIPRLSQFYDGSEVEEPEATVGPLFAIATRADGNCLLHAISICLWGVEDKSDSEVSIIRKALKGFMQRNQFVLFQHYKCAEKRFDQILLGGIETADSDYSKQMDYEIACLDDNKKYLTALHVYCLANMLRRPIVVYSEPNENGLMRGIYLPTMFEPPMTYNCPLTVIWCRNHFTAVLSSECLDDNIHIPLFDATGPLDFPYGFMQEGSSEHAAMVAAGKYVVTYLSLSPPTPSSSSSSSSSSSHTLSLPTATFASGDTASASTSTSTSTSASDAVSNFASSLTSFFMYPLHLMLPPKEPQQTAVPPQAPTASQRSIGFEVARKYLDIRWGVVAGRSNLLPYSERVPSHPARKRLLGASWETFRTVWVGRFKEIAWSYLEEAVLCAYRDKFSVDPTQARQFFAAIREQGSGGLPDNVLRDLYKTLLKTGDISETSSLYERMCMR